MNINLTVRFVALLAWGTCVCGCVVTAPPPSVQPKMPRRGIIPRSYKMKLAVFNLQDPTRSGGQLAESVAEMLHSDLFKTGRFELMERAEIRGIDPGDIDRIKEDYSSRLDALVVGSITHFTPAKKTMALNIRVMNAYGMTMAADAFTVRYTGTINVAASGEDIEKIASWIERAFPKLESAIVLSRSENTMTVNLGSDSGAMRGMWVLIAARGDIVKDPNTDELLGSDIYVGEGYAIGIHPGKSEIRLVPTNKNGRLPQVMVDDKVTFK